MAKGGSRAYREKYKVTVRTPSSAYAVPALLKRQNELVAELWRYDKMIGTRNMILQKLRDHLTPEEKEALSDG